MMAVINTWKNSYTVILNQRGGWRVQDSSACHAEFKKMMCVDRRVSLSVIGLPSLGDAK
jgi:hypothetical protein